MAVQTHAIIVVNVPMNEAVLNVNVQMDGEVIYVWKVNLLQSSVDNSLDLVVTILLYLSLGVHKA